MQFILPSIVLSWLIVLAVLFSNAMPLAANPTMQTSMTKGGSVDDSRLLRRLQNPKFLMSYLFWRAVKRGEKPPRLTDFKWADQPDSPYSFTVEVEAWKDARPRFRFLQAGSSLEQKLGRKLVGLHTTDINPQQAEDIAGSLDGAYRQCVRTMAPSYEYAKYDLGDGPALTFERLILPFVNSRGRITHLVGIVLFDG